MMHWWRWRCSLTTKMKVQKTHNFMTVDGDVVMVVLALDVFTWWAFFTDSTMVTHRCKNPPVGEYIYICICIVFLVTAESKQLWDLNFPFQQKKTPFSEPSQLILRCWVEQTSLWVLSVFFSFLENRQWQFTFSWVQEVKMMTAFFSTLLIKDIEVYQLHHEH